MTIYKFSATLKSADKKVHYRPTIGYCVLASKFFSYPVATYTVWDIYTCEIRMQSTYCFYFYRLGYDGQEGLLFNLDNKNLFYYNLLFDYFHLMVEKRNPLVAYLQESQRSYTSQSLTQGVRLAVL